MEFFFDKEVFEAATIVEGRTQLLMRLLDLGLIDAVVENIRAFEMLGSAAVELGNVGTCWYAVWWLLCNIDWNVPETVPIATMLRKEGRAIRFALDNPVCE